MPTYWYSEKTTAEAVHEKKRFTSVPRWTHLAKHGLGRESICFGPGRVGECVRPAQREWNRGIHKTLQRTNPPTNKTSSRL